MIIRSVIVFLFIASSPLMSGACSGKNTENDPEKVGAILDYSKAVQQQSAAWADLDKIWETLSQEKDPDAFRMTLSLHGIKKLRNYIDQIDRISSAIPELKRAHEDLVLTYRTLEEELLEFLERAETNFRDNPEEARETTRKDLTDIFERTRRKETLYLDRVRAIYQDYGLRLESNTSNRYEDSAPASEGDSVKEEADE